MNVFPSHIPNLCQSFLKNGLQTSHPPENLGMKPKFSEGRAPGPPMHNGTLDTTRSIITQFSVIGIYYFLQLETTVK